VLLIKEADRIILRSLRSLQCTTDDCDKQNLLEVIWPLTKHIKCCINLKEKYILRVQTAEYHT